jgi:hypothetical protein
MECNGQEADLLHVPNIDLLAAMSRLPARGSTEAQIAMHRRALSDARPAKRLAGWARLWTWVRLALSGAAAAQAMAGRVPQQGRL